MLIVLNEDILQSWREYILEGKKERNRSEASIRRVLASPTFVHPICYAVSVATDWLARVRVSRRESSMAFYPHEMPRAEHSTANAILVLYGPVRELFYVPKSHPLPIEFKLPISIKLLAESAHRYELFTHGGVRHWHPTGTT